MSLKFYVLVLKSINSNEAKADGMGSIKGTFFSILLLIMRPWLWHCGEVWQTRGRGFESHPLINFKKILFFHLLLSFIK